MASRDPAFQWETEMLRSTRGPQPAAVPSRIAIDDASDWLTLREASEATGVPTSTIRKWVRHENIPSFLENTSEGLLRVVSMSGIRRWTEEIGREIESSDHNDTNAPAGETEVDLTADDTERPGEAPSAAQGSMMVPLDAWNRMLNQLGNLHEAGQQLAEARERAAKAETEARFLKERLADLREQLETSREPPSHREGAAPAQSLVRKVYVGWRAKRQNRR